MCCNGEKKDWFEIVSTVIFTCLAFWAVVFTIAGILKLFNEGFT